MKKKRKQTNDDTYLIDNTYLLEGMLNNNIDAYRKAVSTFHNSMYRLTAAIVGKINGRRCRSKRMDTDNAGTAKIRAALGAKTLLKKQQRHVLFSDLTKNVDTGFMDTSFNSTGVWHSGASNNKWNIATPDALIESEEIRTLIDSTISSFQPIPQAILKLREYDGLDIQAISNIVEVSETNVRVILHRIRLKLRNAINSHQRGTNMDTQNNEPLIVAAV